jgi:cobalt-zinc-cadmium efflux system membrane fusion protein
MIAVPSSSAIFDKSKNWGMIFKSCTNINTRLVEVYRQLGDVAYIRFMDFQKEKKVAPKIKC